MNPWTPNTPGIFLDLPAVDYHAAPGLSHSMMKHIEPPANLPAYLADPPETTAEMLVGTLAHSLILEPEKELPAIAIKPEKMTFGSNVGVEWRDKQLADGKLIVKATDWAKLEGCVASVSKHPECRKLFYEGQSEVSCFTPIQGTPLFHKCRIDFVPTGNTLADIKTWSPRDDFDLEHGFSNEILFRRYYSQCAHYLDTWNALMGKTDFKEHFLLVVVIKKPPYLVKIYKLDPAALELGRERNRKNTEAYVECMKSGVWPGLDPTPKEIGLPGWFTRKEDFRNRQ